MNPVFPPRYKFKIHNADQREAIMLLCKQFDPLGPTDMYFLAVELLLKIIDKKISRVEKYSIKLQAHEADIFKRMLLVGLNIDNLSPWNERFYQVKFEEIVNQQQDYFREIGVL
jgi:hypothetical protein